VKRNFKDIINDNRVAKGKWKWDAVLTAWASVCTAPATLVGRDVADLLGHVLFLLATLAELADLRAQRADGARFLLQDLRTASCQSSA